MTAITNTHILIKRDSTDGTRDIGGGAIAGIVIGIVVVLAILAGLLAWRLYTYRTNRDFFTGKSNLNYGSASMLTPAKSGHIRSTRGIRRLNDGDSVLEMDGNVDHATENVDLHEDEYDEKHLISQQREQHQRLTQAVNTNQEEWDQQQQYEQSVSKGRYPSETNRTSWWVPSFGRAIPREQVEDHVKPSEGVQSEIMQP
jgi:cytochrome c-type biogenesis protein CcmE